MENIILIGMPASGKSTVGVLLAKAVGYGFIDSDLVIQSREGRLLSRIIEDEGLEAFLRIEEKINAGALRGQVRDRYGRQCRVRRKGDGTFQRNGKNRLSETLL